MARRNRLFNEISNDPNREASGSAGSFVENGGVGNGIDGNQIGVEGSASGGENVTGRDPEVAASTPGTAEATDKPRRRGRPPGSKNQSSTRKVDIDVTQLADQIQGLHVMLAMLTGQPIFQLKPAECGTLAAAVANVGKHYNVSFDGPRAAIIQLVAVGGMIYLPRIVAIRQANQASRPPSEAPSAPSPEENAPIPKDGVIDFSGERLNEAMRGRRRG